VGVEVDNVDYDSFSNALSALALLSTEEIARKAWDAHRLVSQQYTLERYEEGMYNHLKEIIEKSLI
jgi:hypothetical protein